MLDLDTLLRNGAFATHVCDANGVVTPVSPLHGVPFGSMPQPLVFSCPPPLAAPLSPRQPPAPDCSGPPPGAAPVISHSER